MSFLCWLLGHSWMFPMHKLKGDSGPIRSSDYRCSRCGITRDKSPRDVKEALKVQEYLNSIREALK